MGRRYEDHPFDMALVAVATLAAFGVWLLPPDNITTVLAATFLLFVPGYVILFGVLPWRTDVGGEAGPGRRKPRDFDVTRRIVFGSLLSALLAAPAFLVLDLRLDAAAVRTLHGLGLILVAGLYPLALLQWYRLPKSRRFAITFGPRLTTTQETERRVDAEFAVQDKALTDLEKQVARDARRETKRTDKALAKLQRELKRADRKTARRAGPATGAATGDAVSRELDALRDVASQRPDASAEADQAILEGMLGRLADAKGGGGPEGDAAAQKRLVDTLLKQRRRSARREHKDRQRRDIHARRAADAAARLLAALERESGGADAADRRALAVILHRLERDAPEAKPAARRATTRATQADAKRGERRARREAAIEARRLRFDGQARAAAQAAHQKAGLEPPALAPPQATAEEAANFPSLYRAPAPRVPVPALDEPIPLAAGGDDDRGDAAADPAAPAPALDVLQVADAVKERTGLARLQARLTTIEERRLRQEVVLHRRAVAAAKARTSKANAEAARLAGIVAKESAAAARGTNDERDELRAALGRLARGQYRRLASADTHVAGLQARLVELDLQDQRAASADAQADVDWQAKAIERLAQALKSAADPRTAATAAAEEIRKLDQAHRERLAAKAERRDGARMAVADQLDDALAARARLDEEALELANAAMVQEREAGFAAARRLLARGVRFLPGIDDADTDETAEDQAPAGPEPDVAAAASEAVPTDASDAGPIATTAAAAAPVGAAAVPPADAGDPEADARELRRVLQELAREQDAHLATDEGALEDIAERLAAARRHRPDTPSGPDAATAPLGPGAAPRQSKPGASTSAPQDTPDTYLDADVRALRRGLDEVARLQVAESFGHQRAIKRIQRRLAHIAMRRAQRTSLADQRRLRIEARLQARIQAIENNVQLVDRRLHVDQRRHLQATVRRLNAERGGRPPARDDERFLERIAVIIARLQRRRLARDEAALARIERQLTRAERRRQRLAARAAAKAQQAEQAARAQQTDAADESPGDDAPSQPSTSRRQRDAVAAPLARLDRTLKRLTQRRDATKHRVEGHDDRRRDAYATIVSELPDEALAHLVADPDSLTSLQDDLADLALAADRDRARLQARQNRLRERLPPPVGEGDEDVPVPASLRRHLRQQERQAAAEKKSLRVIERQLSRMLALERGEQQRRRDIAALQRLSARAAMRQERRTQRREAWNRGRLEMQEKRQERLRQRLEQERLRRQNMPVPVVLQVVPEESRRILTTVWLYVALITFAELMVANWLGPFTLSENGTAIRIGIGVHVILLVALLVHGLLHVRDARTATGALLVSFTMAPLIRIFSLAMPVVTFSFVQWFTLIGVPLYIALFAIIKSQGLDLAQIGLRRPESRWIGLEVAVVFWSVFFGALEHLILEPNTIFPELTAAYVAAPIVALFVSTGLFEELLFRGVMQFHALRVFRPGMGILVLNAVFAALHLGNHEVADAILVFVVGWIYSQVIFRTKSLVGISIGHTVANIMLFIVGPYIL